MVMVMVVMYGVERSGWRRYSRTQKKVFTFISACAENTSYWSVIYFKTNKPTELYFHQHCSLVQAFSKAFMVN